MSADKNVVKQGDFLDTLNVLEGSNKTELDDVVNVSANEVYGLSTLCTEKNFTTAWTVELCDTVKRCCFTCTVRSDKTENFIFIYMERKRFNRFKTTEMN